MSVYRPSGPDALGALWGMFFGDQADDGGKDKQGMEKFKSDWETRGFIERLEMILHLRDYFEPSECAPDKAMTLLHPYYGEAEFKPIFGEDGVGGELDVDYSAVIGAVHNGTDAGMKRVGGDYRDYLNTFLTHVRNDTLALMKKHDVDPMRKAVALHFLLSTDPREEDGKLTTHAAFVECYNAMSNAHQEVFRNKYRERTAMTSPQAIDSAIKGADVDFLGEWLIVSILDQDSKERDLALLIALQEAQGFYQPRRANGVMDLIGGQNRALIDRIKEAEDAYIDSPQVPIKPPKREFGYISGDPLNEIAQRGVEGAILALQN